MEIGDAFRGSKIKSFDEFSEFTSLKSLPTQAFFQCYNLESIKLPDGLQSIGSFSLGATKIKSLKIPGTVTSINYSSFDSSPIEFFEVGGSSVSYHTIDGILMSSLGKIIKYPEGKTDLSYTIREATSLGQWSLRNTKLEHLDLGSIETIDDTCIVNNSNLKSLTLGKNTGLNNFARYVTENVALQNIYSNNDNAISIDGVLYDSSRTVMIKYPEGRDYVSMESTVKTIGPYAIYNCRSIKSDLILPDHIEVIDNNGISGLQYITGIVFNPSSKLTTVKNNGLQLSSRATYVVFPPSLKYLGSKALSMSPLIGEIKFLGNEAPEISNDTFGSGSDYTGLKANSRVIYVPTNSIGYDYDIWLNTVFNDNRIYIDTTPEPDVTYVVPFILSKTL